MKKVFLYASASLFLLLASIANSTNYSTQNKFIEPLELSFSPCENGQSASYYKCKSINLLSTMDFPKSDKSTTSGNDIWGWTDPATNREYAVMGMNNKTVFVDVTNPSDPIHIGDLPTHTYSSSWRDVKVYKNYAYIVSEAKNHGLQIFDLTKLRGQKNTPVDFGTDYYFYGGFGAAHNIFINDDTDFGYAVGTNTCDAGIHMLDLKDPTAPEYLGCIDKEIFEDKDFNYNFFHGEDYTHDVQCVIYHGPDKKYQGHEICFAANADTVNIVDVTDKAKPYQISVANYYNLGYTHQGWLSEDHTTFYLGDELDEQRYSTKTRTILWDLTDLEKPTVKLNYFAETNSIDHNMYVKGNYLFQANYLAGLRVIDISDENNLFEAAYFDTNPESDKAKFEGVWSVYPYFKSGTVIISGINGKLYTVKLNL